MGKKQSRKKSDAKEEQSQHVAKLVQKTAAHLVQEDRPTGFRYICRPVSERCQSGRSGLSRKQMCPQGYRGFESLPLRQGRPSHEVAGLFHIRTRPSSLEPGRDVKKSTSEARWAFIEASPSTGKPAPGNPSLSAKEGPATKWPGFFTSGPGQARLSRGGR